MAIQAAQGYWRAVCAGTVVNQEQALGDLGVEARARGGFDLLEGQVADGGVF